MTDKLIRDGKVAVLVSPGYGAGWSTWNTELGEQLVFDPEIIQAILDPLSTVNLRELAETKYPGVYSGGLPNCQVEWVPQSQMFWIQEYDGNETLHIVGPDTCYKA